MNNHPTVLKATSALLIGICASVSPFGASAEPVSPFVAATAGIWEAGGSTLVVPEILQSSSIGPVVAEASNQPMANATFRGAFASNGFAIQVQSNVNREAYGASVWSDGFAVTGGAGAGFLTLSTRVSGFVSGLGEMGYALYVSSQPYDLTNLIGTANSNHSGFWALSLPNSTRVMFTGVSNGCGERNWSRQCGHVPFENYQGALDVTLSADVPYTNGQNLYVISVFGGGVGNSGGVESFLNSADFGISAPLGATLQSLSSTAYALAVPEPSSTLMLVAGLLIGLLKVSFSSVSPTCISHRAA